MIVCAPMLLRGLPVPVFETDRKASDSHLHFETEHEDKLTKRNQPSTKKVTFFRGRFCKFSGKREGFSVFLFEEFLGDFGGIFGTLATEFFKCGGLSFRGFVFFSCLRMDD